MSAPQPPGGAPEQTPAHRGTTSSRVLSRGAVTFLDVLGWKGIWLRREFDEVVGELEQLVELAQATADQLRGTEFEAEVRVLSISDTIVLATPGEANLALPAHGRICQRLICESIRKGLPLRGATGFGEYHISEGSILVGPAVDEAASWHEAVDWMGVILTPTATFSWPATAATDPTGARPWIKYPKVPVKGAGGAELWSLNWPEVWGDLTELRDLFAKAGPLDTSIAAKYLNTLNFFAALKKV